MADITRTWTRGLVEIEGNEIVLYAKNAKPYSLFEDPEQHERLLMDLAGLRNLGAIVGGRILNSHIKNQPLAEEFARWHGLLWHQMGGDDSRETWQSWLVAGYKLSRTIGLYMKLKEAIDMESTESLRSFLRATRDTRNASGRIPDGDRDILEHVSGEIATLVSKGLEGCSPTIIAASSLERGNGKKEGPAGDFRSSIDPSNLVAVAYYELVAQIESKAWFKQCIGCGELFRMKPGFHRDRAYCEDACYERTRKSEERAKKREQARTRRASTVQ